MARPRLFMHPISPLSSLKAVKNAVGDVWQRLVAHSDRIGATSLRSLFEQDSVRAERFTRTLSDGHDVIVADFSKQLIDADVVNDLLALAHDAKVLEQFAAMRAGAEINSTEHQAALHTALRSTPEMSVTVEGKDVVAQVQAELASLGRFADGVRNATILGSTGSRFRKIVNIGTGGSDLGPALVHDALLGRYETAVDCKFVANIDAHEIYSVLGDCDPRETLFIVCSKTFTTAETLANARHVKRWLVSQLGEEPDGDRVAQHFVVVSAFPERASQIGVRAAHSFKIWPWVGGRYSISSAVCLAPMIAFGPVVFDEFLSGMREVDDHMQHTAPQDNVPLLLGLLDVWNASVREATSQAVVPYAHALRLLPSYLQQLIMESNGKSVQRDGTPTPMRTSPVIWGGVGTNVQHAFFQMLHQGTDVVPVEFIGFAQPAHNSIDEHDALTANLFAQSQVLAFGRTREEVIAAGISSHEAAHRVMPGNRPSTTLLARELTARTLGALIALYEHRVFVQGMVWDINSFDQWGVELGKSLANSLASSLTSSLTSEIGSTLGAAGASTSTDSSTQRLVNWYRHHRKN